MNPGVADRFLDVFSRYIDSGFGLLGGEVAFLASTLVVIDVTLAALFWSWSAGDDVIARLIKKTLYVGFFAFLLSNFNGLAKIVFQSFSGLGLKAAGSGMSAADVLRPGKLAQSGIDAGKPILESAMQMCGFPQFFDNFPQIAVLMVAWLIVLVAFFVLAVQLFVTLIEFKLTTLAGFILVPFGLFGRTAFLAERVLGNVVASGVKVLVLAVIVGIGSTLFGEFIQDFGGQEPSLEEVLSLALASLCLLGLGIFGPAIANGLVSGAPQLGAGAAVGTGLAAGGLAAAGAMGARAAIGAGVGGARGAIAAARGFRSGPSGSGDSGLRPTPPSGPGGPSGGGSSGGGAPAWARQYQRRQEAAHGAATAAHALRSGDHPGGGTSVSLAEDRS
ncbi:MAG: P-type conjugative transfer protein TrbL [Phenylobacterium sp.]|jgi:type IV secretion system protein TrbL|uniref:P-type conjugative transfer protein TrbL n=1 Tax=unclassified Phenylobacterium TaxID=2640670 RepID=UPI0008BDCA40|nr:MULTISPECIES: P-type conjugative transfer protein TrbL [unclassified Phenylobacterium]MBJ7410186.1 P-type conjugative transfer protein TrbL [Phenylobacterium sp.]OHB28376.1 MAG: P-type conjugative transfer protein TrbL [Phenylobacterium sp. RIFCSPHIGHO2_01_FULL_69_31]